MAQMRLFLPFLILWIWGCKARERADLVLTNALIYTVDDSFSSAQTLVVRDGKIVATGDAALADLYEADTLVDGRGLFVYPGFIDAHSHFTGYGRNQFEVNLFGAASWNEVVERVKEFAAAHPQEPWIIGRGWDQNLWPGKQYPGNALLNVAFPDRPVLLTRVDGHAAIASSRALELTRIVPGQRLTGGEVETREGVLTGVLIDNAVDLVTAALPAPGNADYEKWIRKAQENCFAQGLTTVSDCGLMHTDVAQLQRLEKASLLKMKMYIMLSDDTSNYRRYLKAGPWQTDRLFVKGIKVYADGALGSRGACLQQPYADRPGWSGFLLKEPRYFDSLAAVLAPTRWQMCTHAIGDSANRTVLNIYKKHLKGQNDKRWRIEHAQVLDPADIALFRSASIVPSVQPAHATSDMYWATDRLGNKRMKGAYAYRQLMQQNGWIPLGTDFPVEDISPFKTFLAACYRVDATGYPSGGFQPEEALRAREALRGMTIWAARGCFLEKQTGSLEKGKQADFILLDQDLLKAGSDAVLKTKVLGTWINGKLVYSVP